MPIKWIQLFTGFWDVFSLHTLFCQVCLLNNDKYAFCQYSGPFFILRINIPCFDLAAHFVTDDGGGVRHTYGPVDGSLYAVVRSEPACPGSMDSGISSSTVRLEQHRELDKLLSDMLLTVRDIPDPDIPYHARLDSRPFTYGGLASPSLVRKASPQQQASPDFHEGWVFIFYFLIIIKLLVLWIYL